MSAPIYNVRDGVIPAIVPSAPITEAHLSHDRANWLRVAKERDEIKAERDQLRAEVELDEQLQAVTENSLKIVTAERDQLRVDRYYNHKCINRLASSTGTLGEKSEKVVEVALSTIDQLRAEVATEKNLHAQTRTVVEELNTICTDLRNAGGPPFIRSEAIRLLREDQAALRAEVDQLTDALDMMCDEFQRIVACPGCNSEIEDLANRAKLKLIQRVHVITQRDNAEAELAVERARLDWLEKRGPWESWNGFGEIGIMLRENIRDGIDAAMKEGAK